MRSEVRQVRHRSGPAAARFAREARASDLHLVPAAAKQLQVFFRIDGILRQVAVIEHSASNIVSLLKVLAELLTYRTDLPQEGRIRLGDGRVEMRVSTFPTVHERRPSFGCLSVRVAICSSTSWAIPAMSTSSV